MRNRFALNTLVLACGLGSLALFAGCSDDDDHDHDHTTSSSSSSSSSSSGGGGGAGGAGGAGGGTANTQAVEIQFEARVGNTPVNCTDKFPALGTAGTEVSFADFRLYVHDIRLTTADSKEVPVELDQDGLWQVQNLALLDFEDKTGGCANGTVETNAKIKGKVPEGTYTGLAFSVGVPFELNHNDAATAPSPLNLTAMFWTWNEGYKFIRADAVPSAGGMPFLTHLGSTGCMTDADGKVTSCDRPNRPVVQLMGFDTTKNKVVIDYAAMVSKNDLSMNGGGAPGCMSATDDPECPALMGQLGIHIADGTIHPDEQKVFVKE